MVPFKDRELAVNGDIAVRPPMARRLQVPRPEAPAHVPWGTEAMSMTTSWRDPVPESDPARHLAAAALRAALEDVSPPDDDFTLRLAAAVLLLRSEVLAAPGRASRPAPARLS
jgi:hypothetical protein